MFEILAALGIVVGVPSGSIVPIAAPPAIADQTVVPGPGFHCENGQSDFECTIGLAFMQFGYFQIIDDPAEMADVTTAMEDSLQRLGIPAEIGACDWMGKVASGTASGSIAYGALCSVKIGRQPRRWFKICRERYGSITLVGPSDYAADAQSIELFVRRACF